ncbi:hypothetical protein LJX78_05275 [Methanimicrococcus blatticola]|uniref:hypothetical protein n=1 Tax=Methanimicrococcus blatticola TaxID=91560 RepID=UPI001E59F643|nr:hypothetical protein [Methanimicrococcus blatticola]MCC2509019.1 hypothetical protein [Methanimicrococcus blatticola]
MKNRKFADSCLADTAKLNHCFTIKCACAALLHASALFYGSRSLRERGHCYLPFTFAVVTYHLCSLLLPTVRIRCCCLPFAFAAATYHSHSLLLPTVCIRCCHLPFAFAVAASPFGTPTAAARANRPALKILQKLPRVYNK